MAAVECVGPVATESFAELVIGPGKGSSCGAQETIVAMRQAGRAERIIADAGGKDGARGLMGSVNHLDANEIDECPIRFSVERGGEKCEPVAECPSRSN